MSNATVSFTGQINQANATDALFLKVYAGEVLTAFEENNILLPLTTVRTIANGKSSQFPVVGKIGASYHTPGTEIVGQKVNHGERIITIDELLLSDAFIADIDDAKAHYDSRGIYSTEQGRVLAKTCDIQLFQELLKTARASATVTDGNGGTILTDSNFGSATISTRALALAEAIFAGATAMDEKDCPEERYIAFKPADYYALVQNKDAINRDWGGSGVYSEGNIFRIAGVNILKSNHVPTTDTSSSDTVHGVNASTTKAVMWTKEAVGTVKLMDLSMQSEWDIRRQGTLMVARYAMGHGCLRPDCAVEFKTA